MLEQDLDADQNQDHAARDLRLGLPPRAEHIADLHTGAGDGEGRQADDTDAKERIEMHSISTYGTYSSWQRMISRLVLHGPVTPLVPSSILQQWPTKVYVSETIAAPFGCDEIGGY